MGGLLGLLGGFRGGATSEAGLAVASPTTRKWAGVIFRKRNQNFLAPSGAGPGPPSLAPEPEGATSLGPGAGAGFRDPVEEFSAARLRAPSSRVFSGGPGRRQGPEIDHSRRPAGAQVFEQFCPHVARFPVDA